MWADPFPDFHSGKPLFICILANTETAKIPNISAAGKSPELTDYTPAADAELVETGNAISTTEPAMCPSGAPTPAILTRASVLLTGIPRIYIDAGLNVKPKVPFVDLNATPGEDIRTGKAVSDPAGIYESARRFGESIGKLSDFVIIGESVPGGTTTALGVMRALGHDGKVSSSFPDNPVGIKERVVKEGMDNAGISFGSLENDPIRAVQCLGDPMMPAAAGLVDGLGVKTVLAGGTQMVSVLCILKAMGLDRDVSIATTSYVASDPTANFREMTGRLGFRAYVTDPGFGASRVKGLRMYEKGDVKEGVGAGGSMLAAAMMGISQKQFREKVEEVYESTFLDVRIE